MYPTNGVIILNQPATGSRFENVENLLAVTETIEESCQGTQVHAQTGEEQQVGINTLQLVHDGTNVLHALAHLDAHGIFDTHTECMTIVMSCQIIQTVGQSQCLWIGEAFAHLFDASVNVTAVYVQLLDDFTFEGNTETKDSVSRWMLRTDVDNVFILIKQDFTLFNDTSVG